MERYPVVISSACPAQETRERQRFYGGSPLLTPACLPSPWQVMRSNALLPPAAALLAQFGSFDLALVDYRKVRIIVRTFDSRCRGVGLAPEFLALIERWWVYRTKIGSCRKWTAVKRFGKPFLQAAVVKRPRCIEVAMLDGSKIRFDGELLHY